MKDIQIANDIFKWNGDLDILKNPYYKVSLDRGARIIGVETDSSIEGIVILGDVEVIVDSIIYTNTHGAVGNTTSFTGTNLVILGLSIAYLQNFLIKLDLPKQELLQCKNDAETMLAKLKKTIKSHKTSINIDDDDDEVEFIVFGRRNFLLVGAQKYFVLVHNKQIVVRKGDSKLVQIDPHDGIIIAEKNKVLNIGGSITEGRSILGELGVNLAASILDNILWD